MRSIYVGNRVVSTEHTILFYNSRHYFIVPNMVRKNKTTLVILAVRQIKRQRQMKQKSTRDTEFLNCLFHKASSLFKTIVHLALSHFLPACLFFLIPCFIRPSTYTTLIPEKIYQ